MVDCYTQIPSYTPVSLYTKNHVSIEFSNGAQFSDPNGLLLGNGKFRRHLTFTTPADINTKTVVDFLTQTIGITKE